MKLSPREKDKLLISLAAIVARNRKSRGVKLNYPEAIALISDFVVEGAREGRTVADLMEAGAHVVKKGWMYEWDSWNDTWSSSWSHISRWHKISHSSSSYKIMEI